MRTETRQIVVGAVDSGGARFLGLGFTSSRLGPGNYQVRFTPPLRASPVVTLAIVGNLGTTALAGFADRNGVSVFTTNPAGANTDSNWSFQAIVP